MKRITIEDVRKAAKKIGYGIIRGAFVAPGLRTKKCCPIGALILADSPRLQPSRVGYETAQEILKLPFCYLSGFVGGFDGDEDTEFDDPDYLRGSEDGLSIAKELGFA